MSKEHQILHYLSEGKSQRMISSALGVSRNVDIPVRGKRHSGPEGIIVPEYWASPFRSAGNRL